MRGTKETYYTPPSIVDSFKQLTVHRSSLIVHLVHRWVFWSTYLPIQGRWFSSIIPVISHFPIIAIGFRMVVLDELNVGCQRHQMPFLVGLFLDLGGAGTVMVSYWDTYTCLFHGLLLTSVQGSQTCSKVGRLPLRMRCVMDGRMMFSESNFGWVGNCIREFVLSLVSCLEITLSSALAWELGRGTFRKRKPEQSVFRDRVGCFTLGSADYSVLYMTGIGRNTTEYLSDCSLESGVCHQRSAQL